MKALITKKNLLLVVSLLLNALQNTGVVETASEAAAPVPCVVAQ